MTEHLTAGKFHITKYQYHENILFPLVLRRPYQFICLEHSAHQIFRSGKGCPNIDRFVCSGRNSSNPPGLTGRLGNPDFTDQYLLETGNTSYTFADRVVVDAPSSMLFPPLLINLYGRQTEASVTKKPISWIT